MSSRPRKVKTSYSTREAALISGVSHRTVDYWAKTKLIVPSIADAHGVGTDRQYSFDDLIALRAARELREAGISTQMLRTALEALRERGYRTSECRLVGIGTSVARVIRKGKLEEKLEDALTGQQMFAFMLDLDKNKAEVERMIEVISRAA